MVIDYSINDLRSCLRNMSLNKGDVVYCHSAIGYFGRISNCSNSDALCEMFYDSILEIIGSTGTLIVPTYTYSFPDNKIFDPENSSSSMGIFSEWIRSHQDSVRSLDPCYSVAIIGDNKDYLLDDIPENSFGRGSVFDKFYRLNGKILNFNFPGNTFIHYVERELNVNYRFDKSFSGFVKINNTKQPKSSTIYVRYLSDDSLEHTPVHYEAEARRLNFLQTMRLGRGEISIITSHNVFNLIKNTITSRPYFLTKFEGKGVKAPVLH